MELRVNEVTIPEKIDFNYEELKAELTDKVKFYESLAYTDDQIKDAKADRANLNRLKKAFNDERIRIEKEYMKPFEEFKAQINEIIAIIDKPMAVIDEQVKAFEEKRKAEKQKAIEELFDSIGFQNFVTLDKIQDPKWLNASVSMKSIEEQMRSRMYQIGDDVLTLIGLAEFGFEATEVYKQTLDINKAISEAKSMSEIAKAKADAEAKKKAAEESRKAEEERKAKEIKEELSQTVIVPAKPNELQAAMPPVEPVQSEPKFPVRFEAIMTEKQGEELNLWFAERNIEFKAI